MDNNKKPSEPVEEERWAQERSEYSSMVKIFIIWGAIILCNIFAQKYTPQIMAWYPTYTIVIGLIGTLYLWKL